MDGSCNLHSRFKFVSCLGAAPWANRLTRVSLIRGVSELYPDRPLGRESAPTRCALLRPPIDSAAGESLSGLGCGKLRSGCRRSPQQKYLLEHADRDS